LQSEVSCSSLCAVPDSANIHQQLHGIITQTNRSIATAVPAAVILIADQRSLSGFKPSQHCMSTDSINGVETRPHQQFQQYARK